jgi:hypothetical protein
VSTAEVAVNAEAIKSSGHVAPLIFLVRIRDRHDRRRLPAVCTENLIRVDDVIESPKLAE